MSFKQYIDESVVIKTPRVHKTKVTVNLSEAIELVKKSRLKSDKKALLKRLNEAKQEIPIYCEESNRFFMANLKSKKARDVKSREDKTLCGVLLNAICITEGEEKAKSIAVNWEVPELVFANK